MFEIKARFCHISLISFKSTHSDVNCVNRIGGTFHVSSHRWFRVLLYTFFSCIIILIY